MGSCCCCPSPHINLKKQNKYKADVHYSEQQIQLLKQIKQKVLCMERLISQFQTKQDYSKINIKNLKEKAKQYLQDQDQQQYAQRYIHKIAGQQIRIKRIGFHIKTFQNRKLQLQNLEMSVKALSGLEISQTNSELLKEINLKLRKIDIQNQQNAQINQLIQGNFENLAQNSQLQKDFDDIKRRLQEQVQTKRQKIENTSRESNYKRIHQLTKINQNLLKQNKNLKQKIRQLEISKNTSVLTTSYQLIDNNSMLKQQASLELPNYSYLYKVWDNESIIEKRYVKITPQMIKIYKDKYNSELRSEGYGLNHETKTIKMKEFVRYDWKIIETLWLNGCGIDDKGWRRFVDYAGIFINLKALIIYDNYIQTVEKGDLQRFKSLSFIAFNQKQKQLKNELSIQSKIILKEFKIQNPKIKIDFQ